jgi:hypothetical protein
MEPYGSQQLGLCHLARLGCYYQGGPESKEIRWCCVGPEAAARVPAAAAGMQRWPSIRVLGWLWGRIKVHLFRQHVQLTWQCC